MEPGKPWNILTQHRISFTKLKGWNACLAHFLAFSSEAPGSPQNPWLKFAQMKGRMRTWRGNWSGCTSEAGVILKTHSLSLSLSLSLRLEWMQCPSEAGDILPSLKPQSLCLSFSLSLPLSLSLRLEWMHFGSQRYLLSLKPHCPQCSALINSLGYVPIKLWTYFGQTMNCHQEKRNFLMRTCKAKHELPQECFRERKSIVLLLTKCVIW